MAIITISNTDISANDEQHTTQYLISGGDGDRSWISQGSSDIDNCKEGNVTTYYSYEIILHKYMSSYETISMLGKYIFKRMMSIHHVNLLPLRLK